MARPRKTIAKILKHFLHNTTIHACNFLTMDISLYEKIFWALVNIITISLTITWIRFLWMWYMTDSTFVNFDGTISLHQVEHPGIAICNVNKMSKRRVYQFAKELSPLIKQNNITAIMEDIKLIGNLYDFNLYGEERFQKIQEMLDKYDDKSDFYDPTARIIELTTPCAEILQQCRWRGKEFPCQDIFLTRLTFDGFCCVFNYLRPSQRSYLYGNHNLHNVPTESEVSHGPGVHYGLDVVLNNDLDDYFYTTMETTGFKLHFFQCTDFPDVLSGSLKEYLVGVGERILFNVEVDVIRSTPQIKPVPTRLRKCVFGTEKTTIFGPYTQSDCFVECKLRSMQALCNCIPFVMPIDPKTSKYHSVCMLTDIPCLKKYSEKWSRYFPNDDEDSNLELEKHDSLKCDCLPSCDTVYYNIYTNSVPMVDTVNRNTTRINVLFNKSYGNLYKIDLTFTWFEVISAYGGLISLVMGLSLISIIEVLVLLYKLILYYSYRLYSQTTN